MLYGLYLSAQGAEVQSFRQDLLSNNLANASTTGFKRSLAAFQSHDSADIAEGRSQVPRQLDQVTGGVSTADVVTDFTPGALQDTGAPFDVAVAGKGFLRVRKDGGDFLTRDGRLAIDAQGTLVTRDHNLPVLNVAGEPITVNAAGGPISIAADGTVSQGTPAEVFGQIGVFQVSDNKELQAVGQNLYETQGNIQPVPGGQVRQGFLEASGTRPLAELLELIQSSRTFEANTSLIQAQDDSLGKLLGSMTRR